MHTSAFYWENWNADKKRTRTAPEAHIELSRRQCQRRDGRIVQWRRQSCNTVKVKLTWAGIAQAKGNKPSIRPAKPICRRPTETRRQHAVVILIQNRICVLRFPRSHLRWISKSNLCSKWQTTCRSWWNSGPEEGKALQMEQFPKCENSSGPRKAVTAQKHQFYSVCVIIWKFWLSHHGLGMQSVVLARCISPEGFLWILQKWWIKSSASRGRCWCCLQRAGINQFPSWRWERPNFDVSDAAIEMARSIEYELERQFWVHSSPAIQKVQIWEEVGNGRPKHNNEHAQLINCWYQGKF